MSTVTKKACNIKINGKEISVSEGTVILEACNKNEVPVSNLCYNRKLVPFAACRTCMVEIVVDGKKELVYSCTQPVADGMEVRTGTEETNRYNKACLEMLLVEHPLDCPICDKSGVCHIWICCNCSMGGLRSRGVTNPALKPILLSSFT